MDRCLHLSTSLPRADRPSGFENDVGFSEVLVEAFLAELTKEGDVVLDPFAGFGTTLAVAARMGRHAIGIELLNERAEFIRQRVPQGVQVITGDARELADLALGPVDLVITSPPYMTIRDHPQNPLTGYQTLDGDYERYLAELRDVFSAVAVLLSPKGHVVVNVANLQGREITPLAWDVGREVSRVLHLVQDTVLCWHPHPEGLTNDYCLVFTRRD